MKLFGTLGAFLLSGMINAAPLHNIVVFGDSLSDNGNLYELMKHQLPPSPPYYEGRFSNGPVWVEHLIASYFPKSASAHLFDYAVGGAGVSNDDDDDVLFTLKKQVTTYFLSHQNKADPNDLYVVWIGANNYLALPEETDQTLNDVNSGILASVDEIIKKGAKHVLLINIPDLGRTPAATEFEVADVMSYFSRKHNEMLFQSYVQLKKNNPDVEWLYYDVGTLFADVLVHPAKYGFTNVTNTCSDRIAGGVKKESLLKMVARVQSIANNDVCDGYLFFDLVHPSDSAHRMISEKVRAFFDRSGVVFAE